MKSISKIVSFLVFLLSAPGNGQEDIILKTMAEELDRSYRVLSKQKPHALYFLQYAVYDEHQISISASLGAINSEIDERHRYLDVDVRVGSMKLDNTHEIRGAGFDYLDWLPSAKKVPIDDNPQSLKAIIWAETDRKFKNAQQRYIKILTEKRVKVAETDTSPDFSVAPPVQFSEPAKNIELNIAEWARRLRLLSNIFKDHPWIYNSEISVGAVSLTKYLVNSEGTRLKTTNVWYHVRIYASTMADDGMELSLSVPFYQTDPAGLPGDSELARQVDSLISNLAALREAPVVEPYSGPAILMNKACGVFFHEIFGHRVEGHRQKSEYEGQTFTKKINEKIMPEFISIYDDPTMKHFKGQALIGHYLYDDEGVRSQKTVIVENGILKGFLMSRSPIEGFPVSTGHGRRQHGRKVVARQGVLYVHSLKEVPFEELRKALLEECKKQHKPYGLIFYDIAGGYTITGRYGAQTFKVIPLLVKRVYVDGRSDEVVRGVDIVGTPLLSLSKIILSGDDYDIFNGICGAESGWVPVSSISPSMLVSEIEVEKKPKGQERPPILPAPVTPSH